MTISWKYKIDVSDWFGKDDIAIEEKGKLMAKSLKRKLPNKLWDWDLESNEFEEELSEIIEGFENITGYDDITPVKEFDEWLFCLYEWADYNKTLWVKTL